jgi:hypothetical protein
MDIIEWEDFEYEYKHKSSDWYWAIAAIAVAIAVASILYGNIILAILIIIAATTICIHSTHKPHLLRYELNHKGVIVDKIMYPYATLESFWVEDRDNNPRILFKSHKTFMPYVILPLGPVSPDDARDYLFNFLPEKEHLEPLLQKILEYFGF